MPPLSPCQADLAETICARRGFATGCLAEVDPDVLTGAIPTGKDVRVVRNSGKFELASVVSSWLAGEKSDGQVVAGDRAAWHSRILENRPPQIGPEQTSGVSVSGRAWAFMPNELTQIRAYAPEYLAKLAKMTGARRADTCIGRFQSQQRWRRIGEPYNAANQ